MKSSIIIPLLAMASIMSSCTKYPKEEAPISFGVNLDELSYDAGSSLRPVIICSGTKWTVASMPSWLSLESISSSSGSPYEWTSIFAAQADDAYDWEGQIVIWVLPDWASTIVAL